MRPAATLNLMDEKWRVHYQVNSPKHWKIDIWVQGPEEETGKEVKLTRSIRSTGRCHLDELIPQATDCANAMIDELEHMTGGGFIATPLR